MCCSSTSNCASATGPLKVSRISKMGGCLQCISSETQSYEGLYDVDELLVRRLAERSAAQFIDAFRWNRDHQHLIPDRDRSFGQAYSVRRAHPARRLNPPLRG
jgi:hypothetical protein